MYRFFESFCKVVRNITIFLMFNTHIFFNSPQLSGILEGNFFYKPGDPCTL